MGVEKLRQRDKVLLDDRHMKISVNKAKAAVCTVKQPLLEWTYAKQICEEKALLYAHTI